MSQASETHRFWSSLSTRALLPFYAGAFFMFAAMGPLLDVADGGAHSPRQLAATTLFAGLVAVAYAYCAIRRMWLFPVALGLQFAGSAALGSLFPENPAALVGDALGQRLRLDALATLALMSLGGYGFFVMFIVTQGRKHVRLQAEIGLARRLHETLVPAIAERYGRYDVFARSWPATEVGGDLVDAFDTHGALYASVVDVSGHGVNAGALMGMIKAAARTELRREPTLGQLLETLNDVLLPIRQPGMFATAACLRLEPGDEEAALAGHPPILHWRAATRDIERIEGANLPLAMFPDQRYASRPLDLEEGDLLVILTDGLFEVMDVKGRELGFDEIVATVERNADESLEAIHDRILEQARRHGPQEDDQSLLLVRVVAS